MHLPDRERRVRGRCGTLVVSEDHADPRSRLLALPVVRIHARSTNPGEPIFRLEGGPGMTNMDFDRASRFVDDRDLVLVGYRGVDGPERLDCPEVNSVFKRSTDVLSEQYFRAYAGGLRECATRLAHDGIDPSRYGLIQQIDDLEAARVALGYDRINLLSESAGTRTALIYSWRYPERIHRSVMTGVNPPGNFLWDPGTTDELMHRYALLCAEDAECSARTDDLAATMRQVATDMPEHWLFLPIKTSNVRVISFYGLMESSSAATAGGAPAVFDAWLSAAEGDPSGLWITSVLQDVMFPNLFVLGQHAAAGRIDADAARRYFASDQVGYVNLGRAATASGWAGGLLDDAWPAAPGEREYNRMRTSQVETLLIGGELDFSTPPQVTTEQLLPYLSNGHEVVLPGFGHNATFWAEQPEAGTRLINTFFDSGRVDDSSYDPHVVEFSPSVTFGTVAKAALAAMFALAALTVLSLLGMARHVHRRGSFGWKSSAILRSLSPVVIGLGGWCLGALLVMSTIPAVSLDNQLVAVLAVGTPIGLGVYWAWVHRAWATPSKTMGVTGAVGGALVGAWFGFHGTEGLLTVLTAIAGATVGANLIVLLIDIARPGPRTPPLLQRTVPDPELSHA